MSGPLPDGLQRVAERRRFGVRPGLEAVRRLLHELGEPQKDFAAIHLAGTNGKGSTAAMLAAALLAAGYRVGLYTSPHLCRFNERIVVNGLPVDDEVVGRLAHEALEASADATFFEIATAMAFRHFSACGIEIAVVETGLGGRWDATNVVDPLISAITPIALDHVGVLGSTLASIAAEKAGIIKGPAPVVCARQEGEALRVLQRRAVECAAALCLEGRDFDWESTQRGMDFRRGDQRIEGLKLGLRGRHQEQNAALALATLGIVGELGWPVSPEATRRGLLHPQWPGRLEELGHFLLDCAHNPAAAAALAVELAVDPRPTTLIFGALAEKSAEEMLACLAPHASTLLLCAPSGPRAGDLTLLDRAWPEARVVAGLDEALLAARGAERVVITGSCYLVGEARARLLGQQRDGLADPSPTIW